MSQLPGAPGSTTYVQASPSNGLGVAGFITSLVGIVTCGLLCPIGLILSFIAIFRRPRGFAVAGLVIGIVGTLIPVVIFLIWGAAVLAMFGFAAAVGPALQTYGNISTAESRIHDAYAQHMSLPTDDDGDTLIDDLNDQWSHPLRYHRLGPTRYEIRSAGPDGSFDTPDDIIKTFNGSDAPSQ
ncbi:MAG TPA: DUF4190 domain-containing protein [Phycisphaerae bacterium]|nr:DUF4190 domain-containing protein [Phycisphaerae bacterium]